MPAASFRLLRGKDNLGTYTFGTHTAKHMSCRVCGVKSFYVPRSNPDGFSINVNCLEPATIEKVETSNFDGRNWERHAASLAHLSKPA